jgi:hypothetical protein
LPKIEIKAKENNMKNLILISLVVLAIPVFSQTAPITVRYEQNSDRTVSIYADNSSDADYTIKLMLSMTGMASNTSNPALLRVSKGSTQLAKLTPEKNSGMPSWKYSYQYFPGLPFRKAPDTSVVYLLPGTEGNILVVGGITDLPQMFGQKSTSNNFTTPFLYQYGDTICASRAGIVYEAYNGAIIGEKNNQILSTERNKLNIQHKDGTLSHYTVLSPIKLLVGDGQYVVPGQPLAVFNKESDKYIMMLNIRYLDEKALSKEVDLANPSSYYISLRPLFYSDGAATSLKPGKNHTVVYSKEVIAKELSKKEKKKLGLE